ncbi:MULTISPECIES: ParB N-terminal domain-containing protein [Streptacidiphilus]|uniref:ParB N-terminal domain-containing protein n=1 Tax=Streptacidiphilus cavernicola TaxID=3342716 RepID=A0ABV6UNZ6_9ACTN|nr:ParB N-terminal domain-containing protein [Streptacidiphilus jeojiense]
MTTTVEADATQAGSEAVPAAWPTIAVDDLLAHPGNDRTTVPSAGLLAGVEAEGVTEPLYIVRSSDDAPQIIDGFQRLAAAVLLGLESVPFTPRPVIRIEALTPHPKNVREDLDVDDLVPSLQEFGCRDLIKIQRVEGGGIQVNDGNRRLFAAPLAGLTHLPYEWDEDQDEAGQILGMITSAQHRKGLTQTETMAAMFSAAEAGATVGKIATAAGVRHKDVKAVVKSRTDESVKKTLESSIYAWTFDQLAALGEFADDPEALEAITSAAEGWNADDEDVEWAITVQRTRRDKRMQGEAHRAELERSGQQIRVMAELSDRATPVWRLRTPEGGRITAEEHADCKGQVWVLESQDDKELKPYCTSPTLYGHAEPGASNGKAASSADQEAEKEARAGVKLGNLHWDAAETRRRQWISDMVKRRTLSKETAAALAAHVTTALVDGTWDVGGSLNAHNTGEILAGLLGLTKAQAASRSGYTQHLSKDPKRATQLQFAAIAAVRERGAGRYAWRTDGMRCNDIRTPTGRWIAVLEGLGYTPTAIERAVKENTDYDPSARPALSAGQQAEDAEGDQGEDDQDDQGDDAEAAE